MLFYNEEVASQHWWGPEKEFLTLIPCMRKPVMSVNNRTEPFLVGPHGRWVVTLAFPHIVNGISIGAGPRKEQCD